MQSGKIPAGNVVKYRYSPSMSLAEYDQKVNQPNGTHASEKCGDKGSFLACYLEDHVINVFSEEAGIKKLQEDAEQLDALISKGRKILFEEERQLFVIFETLKTKLNLYRALLEKGYLTLTLQCKNKNTFLHSYLKTLHWKDENALQAARDLIQQDKSVLAIRGEAGYPLTILLENVSFYVKTGQLQYPAPDSFLNLLKACQLDEERLVLDAADEAVLLKNCFELLIRPAFHNIAFWGFEAVMAAASMGMSLEKSVEGCFDGKTSLFAYILELDSTLAWGVDRLRRLMQAAKPSVAKLAIKVNPEAMQPQKLSDTRPDDLESYGYAQVKPEPGQKSQYVMTLAAASEFYKPSSIMALWSRTCPDELPLVGRCETVLGLEGVYRNRSNSEQTSTIPLAHISEKYLPKNSKYRATISWGGREYSKYLVRFTSKYGFLDQAEYELLTRNFPSGPTSISHMLGFVIDGGKVPSELKRIIARDKSGRDFFQNILSVYNDINNRARVDEYYPLEKMVSLPPVRKNALLVYLEKGGAVSYDPRQDLNPLQFYVMIRSFSRVSDEQKAHPVLFEPGQIPISGVFQDRITGEFLLRQHYSEYAINTTRVYDLELIKQFKRLGFDFSSPEITEWLSNFLHKKALSPKMFAFLDCLKACGVVFPAMINGRSYHDHMIDYFSSCRQEYGAWVDKLKKIDRSLVEAHLARLGLPLNPEIELTPADYAKNFEEQCLALPNGEMDYPKLLVQWLGSIHSGQVRYDDQVYDKVYGSFPLAITCLSAYVESNDYLNQELLHYAEYFAFFFEIIKNQLQLFRAEVTGAINHESKSNSKLVNKLSIVQRGLFSKSVVGGINAKIDALILRSAGSLDDMRDMIASYIAINDAIRQEAANRTISSDVVYACFNNYSDNSLFVGEQLDLSSFANRSAILDIVPVEMQNEHFTRLLANLPKPEEEQVPVDNTYKPDQSRPVSVSSAPPVQEVVLPPKKASQPLTPLLFEKACTDYKTSVDAFYQASNMPSLLANLNAEMDNINQRRAQLPAPLAMLICLNTGKLAQYPCFIDQSTTAYYDLDALLPLLGTEGRLPGVNGLLTPERISFKPMSEFIMAVYVLEQTRAQLDLMAAPAAQPAYGYGMRQ